MGILGHGVGHLGLYLQLFGAGKGPRVFAWGPFGGLFIFWYDVCVCVCVLFGSVPRSPFFFFFLFFC